MLVTGCDFDRNDIFHPLVLQYLVSVAAFNELGVQGIGVKIKGLADQLGLTFEDAVARLRAAGAELPGQVPEASWGSVFKTRLGSQQGTPVDVDVNLLAEELADRSNQLLLRWAESAMALVVMAFEIAKARGYVTKDPLWEFLRHCRHASSHGNKFHFLSGEPLWPAQWRNLRIGRELDGTPLFQDEASSSEYLLKPGDPVHLLWDIEQHHASLRG